MNPHFRSLSFIPDLHRRAQSIQWRNVKTPKNTVHCCAFQMFGTGQETKVCWRLEVGIARPGEILVFCEIIKGIKLTISAAISEGVSVYFQQAEKSSSYIVFLSFFPMGKGWFHLPILHQSAYPYNVNRFIPVFKAARQDRRWQFLWARLWSCLQFGIGKLPEPPVGINHTVKLTTGWCKAKS